MTLKTGSPDRVKRPTECVDEAPDESSAGVSVDKVTLCVAHLDVPNVLIRLLNVSHQIVHMYSAVIRTD